MSNRTSRIGEFFQWGFELLITGAAIIGVSALQKVSDSINDLNVKIGVIVERTDSQAKAIERFEDRLRRIELEERPRNGR